MNSRMRARGRSPALVAFAAWLSLTAGGPAVAQTANFPPGGPKLPSWSDLPDWDGLWERGGDLVWDDRVARNPGEPEVPPFTDQYMKEYLARRTQMREEALAGRPRYLQGGGLYGSMPGMMIMLFPMDIQINPREVVIMTANGGAREIYTDGRLHPADPLPSTKGHSIGRWEGQTLVIDTCCVRSDTRLPGGGSHSDVMHITERISSPDGHTLKDAITVEDPKAFTKPWTTEKTYYRRPDWEQVEYDRDENTRDFGKASPPGERPTNSSSPPAAARVVSPAANRATPAYAATAPSGPPADSEALQKATAIGAGNLAWETVTVSDIRRDATTVKWLATTKSTKWHCTAAPDGTKPYCER